MTEKKITIKKGELILKGEDIKIDDDAIFNRNLLIVSSLVWCFYGVLNIIRYPIHNNFFYFYFGVFILALWIVVVGFVIFRVSFKKNYTFSEIQKVKFRLRSKGFFSARILTKKGRIRTLTLSDKKEDLNMLVRQLKKRKIKLEMEDLK